MLTKEQRQQAVKFQDAIGELVDTYMLDGMGIEVIKECLKDEASSDLYARRMELRGTK